MYFHCLYYDAKKRSETGNDLLRIEIRQWFPTIRIVTSDSRHIIHDGYSCKREGINSRPTFSNRIFKAIVFKKSFYVHIWKVYVGNIITIFLRASFITISHWQTNFVSRFLMVALKLCLDGRTKFILYQSPINIEIFLNWYQLPAYDVNRRIFVHWE